jgi:hypothetical protein
VIFRHVVERTAASEVRLKCKHAASATLSQCVTVHKFHTVTRSTFLIPRSPLITESNGKLMRPTSAPQLRGLLFTRSVRTVLHATTHTRHCRPRIPRCLVQHFHQSISRPRVKRRRPGDAVASAASDPWFKARTASDTMSQLAQPATQGVRVAIEGCVSALRKSAIALG